MVINVIVKAYINSLTDDKQKLNIFLKAIDRTIEFSIEEQENKKN